MDLEKEQQALQGVWSEFSGMASQLGIIVIVAFLVAFFIIGIMLFEESFFIGLGRMIKGAFLAIFFLILTPVGLVKGLVPFARILVQENLARQCLGLLLAFFTVSLGAVAWILEMDRGWTDSTNRFWHRTPERMEMDLLKWAMGTKIKVRYGMFKGRPKRKNSLLPAMETQKGKRP